MRSAHQARSRGAVTAHAAHDGKSLSKFSEGMCGPDILRTQKGNVRPDARSASAVRATVTKALQQWTTSCHCQSFYVRAFTPLNGTPKTPNKWQNVETP